MMMRPLRSLVVLLMAIQFGRADTPNIERTIGKEPAYQTRAPKYGLLTFGPECRHKVWLVQDGNTLYVDRKGDGNLADPACKVTVEVPAGRPWHEETLKFDVGDLLIGGATHQGLKVWLRPLKPHLDNMEGPKSELDAVLKKDPRAMTASISLHVQVNGMKNGGLDGRLVQSAGPADLQGVLLFGDSPATAPVVHFGGPLQITFYAAKPVLRVGRECDVVTMVGTPGIGGGTFAAIGFENTIPKDVKPGLEIKMAGAVADRQTFKLENRC